MGRLVYFPNLLWGRCRRSVSLFELHTKHMEAGSSETERSSISGNSGSTRCFRLQEKTATGQSCCVAEDVSMREMLHELKIFTTISHPCS